MDEPRRDTHEGEGFAEQQEDGAWTVSHGLCAGETSRPGRAGCLDAQAARIQAHCQLRSLTLVDIMADPAVFRHTRLAECAGGQQLLAAIAAAQVQHVITLKLDRLCRNTMDWLTPVEVWTHHGVGMHILDEDRVPLV